MKLIKPSYSIWEQESGLEGVYKMIEKVGRVCYKSEDKITEGTAKSFVDRLMKSGHGAMLEHGTIYLMIPNDHQAYNFFGDNWVRDTYGASPYSSVVWDSDKIYITTNLRVLVENGWLDDLKYLCEPTEYHVKRVTVHFVCDRGVSHEFVRHRTFSFAQESTRYCNYSKDKFGNELTFIKPCWFDSSLIDDTGHWNANTFYRMPTQSVEEGAFLGTLLSTEKSYFNLLECGWKPQEARAVLPNALKTELVMTGFVDESGWINFFSLRALGTTGAPHPQAKELAEPLFEEFKAKGLIK